MPHQGVDPITIGAQLQTAWQTIVSRTVSPTDPAVISVTQIHAGDTWNVIPDKLVLRGTVRSFDPKVRDLLETKMAQRAERICAAFDAGCHFIYARRYPATINSAPEAQTARRPATLVAGHERVVTDGPPVWRPRTLPSSWSKSRRPISGSATGLTTAVATCTARITTSMTRRCS